MLKYKIQIFIGLWLIISPWLFGVDQVFLLKWSNIAIGLFISLSGLWEVFGEKPITTGTEKTEPKNHKSNPKP